MRSIGVALVLCLLSAMASADGTDITVPDKIAPVKPKPARRRPPAFSGQNAPKSAYRTDPLPKPSGDLWITAPNLGGEEVHVQIYKKDGSFDNAALAKLDDLFRCAATGEVRAIRAELYEIQKFAATLDTGNMGLGIYPTGGFIHLDVRAPGEPSFRWTDYSGPSG